MSLALDSADCGLTIQSQDLKYLHIGKLPVGVHAPEMAAADDQSIFGNLLGEKLKLAKMALVASGEPQHMSTISGNRVISFSMSPMLSNDRAIRIVTVVQDITKARRREATMRTLLLELSHRSKNLLAIIQGLATQSAKHARSLNDFMPAFIGRLHAVSAAQDVIVDANWQRASLHELAKRQLQSMASDRGTTIRFSGPDLELDPNQSLHIGLALHELAMASAMIKDTPWRRISIEAGGDENAYLVWKSEPGSGEHGHAPDFGTALLERVVPTALSGKCEYRVDANAITWRIDFPINILQARKSRKKRAKSHF